MWRNENKNGKEIQIENSENRDVYDVLVDALKSIDKEDLDRSLMECRLKESLTELLSLKDRSGDAMNAPDVEGFGEKGRG